MGHGVNPTPHHHLCLCVCVCVKPSLLVRHDVCTQYTQLTWGQNELLSRTFTTRPSSALRWERCGVSGLAKNAAELRRTQSSALLLATVPVLSSAATSDSDSFVGSCKSLHLGFQSSAVQLHQ